MPRSPDSNSQNSLDEQLRLFISGVADYAIYMLSPEGYINSWNAGAQRFKGYTAEEIVGEHFSRFYTPEDRAKGKPARALQTAVSTGKFEEEGWRVRKDGTRFWASVVLDPIFDKDGILLGFAKITRDVTERRAAEEALRTSEERFRLLVQGVTDYAIYMLSPEGTITNWNAGAERFKGYTQDEVVGTHFSRFYTEEDRTAGLPEKALHTAAVEGRFESEGWRVRKDGTRFWTHVVIDPIFNRMGELLGFGKITRDITERRNAAEALERTKAALFQSQKLEAIGKLTGGIAHDFNNLLSVVVNGIEILAAHLHDPTHTKILESMRTAAERGATLNQQLLAFARRQPLKHSPNDLNTVINSFGAVLRRACNEKVNFRIQLADELDTVLIDSTQFEAALLNLVTNARDAMPEGGTLMISTGNVELQDRQVNNLPGGNYVKISIADTGIGMSKEVAAKVLEPFFTTKPMGKGTGMGLSQVYGLMQQSNGDILIRTEPGRGTVIELYLPIHRDAANENAGGRRSRAGRALIVDDQPDVLTMAIELFKIMDYDVLSANNGQEALEVLRQNPAIDILFTDIMMPGMNGLTLASEALKLTPELEIVLTSGYTEISLLENSDDLHNYKFIQKPYSTVSLQRTLQNVETTPAGNKRGKASA